MPRDKLRESLAVVRFHVPRQQAGRLVSLDTLLDKGPVAITFHRGHWCPYCRINTRPLAQAQGEIAAEGGQIAAIMPDQQHYTAGLKAESDAPFPIRTGLEPR